MCTDFTDLNKACPKDPYPLPRIDLLVDSTAGYELFSMMDAYQGYHQIFMAEEDRIKTSFVTDQDRNLSLLKALRKAKEFEWTEECDQALKSLKQYLATPPLLVNPKPGENLFLYLAISEDAVSSVLVCERERNQNPVYYVSKMLQGAERKYTQIEKLALALVVTARKLRLYFQSHKVVVLTNHPLKHIMTRPDASGRIHWRTGLEEKRGWLLHVDGSSNANNGGAGVLLRSPDGVEMEMAARLSFPATNNEAEYEALVLGLQLALEMGVKEISMCTDSQLVAMQVEGSYETREQTMVE
ncbi:UNVERIFIED_CONTAM: Ribonuclease HI [Sesamum radiatum]|uniref:Ribonuclease HI n=1 Tax=Sesamum radiatum TaxID=300843 RepID=A0AAW2L2P9_SESRA